MSGSLLYGSSEVSSVSGSTTPDGTGKAHGRKPVIDAGEKSDTSIVPKKPPNKGSEAVEGRGVARGNADQTPAFRTQGRGDALTGLARVREVARRDRRVQFTALLHHLTPALLLSSFYELRRTAAAGVDGVTWEEYEVVLAERLLVLHRAIHTGSYRAQPSRRVYIAKDDGRQRPLGIAAIEDKIVQQAVSTILNAIYEQDFLGFSYGFRCGRSQHDALDALTVGIKSRNVNWILDADISSFFDEIDHEWMLRFLGHRVADQRIVRLIRNWLKAGVIENGQRVPATKGTPQGAVISPLLANIYLHYALDQWVQQWRQRHCCGRMIAIRYADDSVFGFEREDTARRFLVVLHERMARFGLVLHPAKTRLLAFGRSAAQQRRRQGLGRPETFDFLGFTHCCGRTRGGGFQIVRLTSKKRMRATLRALRQTLWRRRHEPVTTIGPWLGRVVQGYYQYHAIPTNMARLRTFRVQVCRAWRDALLRRSQRRRLSWPRMQRLTQRYIPLCRMLHPYPEARFYAS